MKREKKFFFFQILFVFSLFLSAGCAVTRNPVPRAKIARAQIPGMPEIRTLPCLSGTDLQANLAASFIQEREEDFPTLENGKKEYKSLIISGGGANGAYGAGLLNGWLDKGTRPLFKVITGVSTGAIMAPLVFLGEDYKKALKEYYTTTSTKDVMASRGLFGFLFGDSLASSRPLRKQIAFIFDNQVLEKIARQHQRGRRLFIGTVNLDADKLVVWDMGAIAVRGDKNLFHKIVLASASIPGIFPPISFDVEVNGVEHDELHIDGGTLGQMFSLYSITAYMKEALQNKGIDTSKIKTKTYIIRNGYMTSRYMEVDRKFIPITERALDIVLDAQGLGEAYKIYTYSKQIDTDYNLAFIPGDFESFSREPFDPNEMKRLYERGYQDGAEGYDWHKVPPGFRSHPVFNL